MVGIPRDKLGGITVLASQPSVNIGATFGHESAASAGVKPTESQGLSGLRVAANYRPAGMDPVVAKAQANMLHSVGVRD